jgi:ABC-type glycerol-3-phosphate transport system substrate-binding protein
MKKIFAVFGIILMGLTFSGCEKKPESATTTQSGEGVEMQIWTARESEIIKALSKEFISAVNMPGIKVDVVTFESDEILQKTLIEKMAEGEGPDVVLTNGDWIAVNTKKLVPLKLKQGFGMNEYGASFVRIASELLIQKNAIYGMPLSVDTLAIVYNEEHLIDRLENRNHPGRTWREYKKDVELLTKQDKSFNRFARAGTAIGRTDNTKRGIELLENIMLQYGTPFFSEDQTTATFASTEGVTPEGRRQNLGVTGLRFFTSFANEKYKNFSWNEYLASSEDINKEFSAFAKGDVSMVFAYPKDLKTIQSLIKSEKGGISEKNMHVAMLPQILDPENLTSRIVLGELFASAVIGTTKYPNTSWKLLKFLSKRNIQSGFHDATGLPTARLDLILEQAAKPERGIFARQAKFARSNLMPINKISFKKELDFLVRKINKGGNGEELLSALESKMSYVRQEKLKQDKLVKRNTEK